MRKKYSFFVLIAGMLIPALFSGQKSIAQNPADTIVEQVTTLRDRVGGVEERITTAENDLAKLTKIKFSGYVQAQWQHFENPSLYPSNYFTIRRARFKLQYEPATGVALVIQPDFQPGNFVVKEAYARLNDRWLKTFSLWVGKFNRPNYEVEYSSADLELLERSRLITSIYPGEYAIGAKLEVAPQKLPLKFQLAVFNGNDNMTVKDASGANINPDNKDFDNAKDIMARLTYAFRLGRWGGLTIGAHGYYGWMKANDTVLLNGDYTKKKTLTSVGTNISKNWVGVEAQFYADILGGLTLKGEYITGINVYPGYTSAATSSIASSTSLKNDTLFITNTTTKTTLIAPAIEKSFSGYYVYLIKNIGKRNQFAARYDYYDPNTKLKGDQIGAVDASSKPIYQYDMSSSVTKNGTPVISGNNSTTAVTKTVINNKLASGAADIAYGTLALGWTYFFDDNLKISLEYEFPVNEKVGVNSKGIGNVTSGYTVNNVAGTLDYSKKISQNALTIRIQAKF